MSSFYDILKAAKVGGNRPPYYETLFARKLPCSKYAWQETTLTGIPPISFRANGTPLTAYSITGNMQKTGTPTPDAPIYPEFAGERTKNLFDWSAVTTGYRIALATGTPVADETAIMSDFIPVSVGTYRANASFNLVGYDANKAYVGTYDPYSNTFRKEYGSKTSYYIISDPTVAYVKLMSYSATDTLSASTMINAGTTVLPYEPYGYKLPITCGSQTTPVYLGQTQTVRKIKKLVLDGTEDWVYQSQYERFVLTVTDIFATGIRVDTFYTTHYQVIDDGRNIGNVPNNAAYIALVSSTTGNINIKTDTYASADDFKAYLAAQYSAGTPVTIWYVLATPETSIVNEPLCKIGDYVDTVASTNTGAPSIPTVKGQNTLTVDTTLAPSSVSITGKIKEV